MQAQTIQEAVRLETELTSLYRFKVNINQILSDIIIYFMATCQIIVKSVKLVVVLHLSTLCPFWL